MELLLGLILYFGAIALFCWGFVWLDTNYTHDIDLSPKSIKEFLQGKKKP